MRLQAKLALALVPLILLPVLALGWATWRSLPAICSTRRRTALATHYWWRTGLLATWLKRRVQHRTARIGTGNRTLCPWHRCL